ncbi:MAG: hypothetical protein C0597_15105 [Marinilabiliales bacterium]|nr:MAG: hypothetical protein C0597_15105 [Marinilabiliales bacterium]
MFDKFIESIQMDGSLNESDISELREHDPIKFYKKGETILSSGKNVRNIYFVIDGCIRLYYYVDGKDKTVFFYQEGNFIWAANTIKYEVLRQKNYEAITDSMVVKIDKEIAF